MIWYEVIEDLVGDGTCITRRFRTKAGAEKYLQENMKYCDSGVEEVDTDSWNFFCYDPYEEIIND